MSPTGNELRQPPVLVAPDSFKGTFHAIEVAKALCAGFQDGGRAADACPLADGGEGTLEALTAGDRSTELHSIEVGDPLGRPVTARYALIENGKTAVVETAEAVGLVLLTEAERNPEVVSSAGAGELILAALEQGVDEVLVGLGGSATVDGGRGLLAVLKEAGRTLSAGRRTGPKITVLCDARSPWEEAAKVFGPQKGADPAAVARLTKEMVQQAKSMRKDPTGINYTGAAGGIGGALWSECGAELVAGAQFVMDRVNFDARMRASRAVIVGEGRMDSSTLLGKAPGEAATRARQAGVPCAAVCGVNALDPVEERIIDLQVVIEAGDLKQLRAAGRTLADLI
ncbi:MAG: glycerate kinase [Actinobacteria bacterium]|uniref:Unannotated protein n=1 Tax=freshwater metagenome TaxID=449393 RepID=A0A6J7EDZ9_9ZZZZ|nr:glycerate kinase [Actinomycetota bacterium]